MDDALSTLLDMFESGLRGRAESLGWSLTPNSQLLRQSDREGIGPLLTALSNVSSEPRPSERLPELRRGFDLQPVSLSLLLCGLDAVDFEGSYRAALWWTGLVRSEIAPSRRSDLHLFLIGPMGTSSEADWGGIRSRIESDERFCRKFVWLPTCEPDPVEIGEFLNRTFLAQPWKGKSAEPRSLDPLEPLIEGASVEGVLASEELRRWLARLGSVDVTKVQQIAEDLVSILEGKP